MSNVIKTEGLEVRVAVLKPTVVGAALKIFMMGGSKLTEKEAGLAAGSPYLLKQNHTAIMGLVEEFEARRAKLGEV